MYNFFGTTWVVLFIIFYIVFIIAMWRIFGKAGEHGWMSVVPVLNLVILFRISWGNGLFVLLMLIPVVNIIIVILTMHKLSKAFGYGILFTLGLVFFTPVFYLILGYGPAVYTQGKD